MYRAPGRAQRSPGAPRPAERFPSPASCWAFPGARSPYGGPAWGASSPQPQLPSPGSYRGYRDGSPSGFGGQSRGFGGQSRGFGGQSRGRGDGSRRPQSFSPASAQGESVEKYFSPSMLQDPWEALQPVAARQTS